ncbi:MAG TPA: ABC transporter ATP-binding protein [Bryobacteraceae bacterium]|nr:ABC transporter ATP-binding protein [Bryobacteraceae bacterium]
MRETKYQLWLQYLRYFWPYRALLCGITAAGFAQSFAYIPLAALLRRTFDVVLPARDTSGLLLAIGGLLGIQVGTLLLAWWTRMAALRASQEVVSRLRQESIQRLYELPRGFHTSVDAERLHVTLVYETNWIESMNNALAANLLPAALSAMVLFLLLFWTEPRYALIIGVSAPALFTLNRMMTRKAWFRQERLRQAFEEFARGVRFAIGAMDLTKSQAAERIEMKRQGNNVENLRQVSLDLSRFDSGQQLFQSALLLASTLAVLLAGGWAIAQGRATSGQIMAFYVFAALFASQARTIVEAVPAIRMGLRAFARVAGVLRVPEREPYQGAVPVGAIHQLCAKNLSFAYGDKAIFEDASIDIQRGERISLIGANGSGKSTLLFLILGFYRPRCGALFVNGRPYDEIDIHALRSRMAIVPQIPFLFAANVRDNVSYGAGAVSDEAIWEALSWAGARPFVSELPQGLDSEIGEQGVRLSGGQRQRLVIARALLRRPDLLILDEPTNHLDENGIAGLMHTLERLPFRPAVIIISHEARVLRHTDRAWRLVAGRLEEAFLEQRL